MDERTQVVVKNDVNSDESILTMAWFKEVLYIFDINNFITSQK